MTRFNQTFSGRLVIHSFRLAVFVVCLTTATPPLAAQVGGIERSDDAPALRQIIDGVMKPFLAQHQAPGAIVAVSLKGRRHFFPYGNATNDGAPFTPTTLVEIGSCTKVFTTTLFALAINRRQIAPDESAQKYMPEGYTLQPSARQITPAQLAEFTSGMPDDPPDLPRQLEMRGIDNYTTRDFLRWASGWKPATAPPAPYLYSNAGIGLLSYLVAEATGKSWEEQLNSEIIRPLGMTDTAMRPNAQQMTRIAQGHRLNGTAAPPWPVYAWFAAGALRSTATDMLRFGEANLFHKEVEGRQVSAELLAAMKLAQAPVYPLPEGGAKQGMAWVTNYGRGESNLAPEVLKNGGTDGFSTVILTNARKDAAIFIAINRAGSNPAPLAVEIGRRLP